MLDFAVIETGGKQYPIELGSSIYIEIVTGDFEEGGNINFDKVLLTRVNKRTTIGTPYVSGADVSGIIEKIGREKKVEVSHFKNKTRQNTRYGHRQPFFKVRIEKIA